MPSLTFVFMQPSARRMVAERRVELLQAARDDLKQLYDYIADHSGAHVADRYIDRLEAAFRIRGHNTYKVNTRCRLGVRLRNQHKSQ